ncbi:MAG: DNA-protecting protein DprA [Nitrospirae bacterium]|nr:DNA-protecting protein DprA [Nitrospirota bacterium]
MKTSVTTAQGKLVAIADDGYPAWLRAIADPPAVLYCDGQIEPRDRQAIAIVGARQATPYGLRATETLARELSGAGFTIVSGLARGIDAAAHRAALEAGGRTIAVLGCGLDVTYPPEHGRLREEIAGSGAVLTEFAPGTPPWASNFPRRNRIISGLSLGVVVVEAAEDSGSLITARLALEQGREVFAVPGSIDAPLSRGPHGLLKQGAKLVETVDDIVEELLPQLELPLTLPAPLTHCSRRAMGAPGEGKFSDLPGLSAVEQVVLAVMSRDPLHLDDLTERSGLTPAGVAGILLGLELKDIARQLPGQRYVRVR